MSKVGNKLLEHLIKSKFGYLHEELKTERQSKVDDIFTKLDELVKILGETDKELLQKYNNVCNENKKLTETNEKYGLKIVEVTKQNQVLSENNKALELRNATLGDQIAAFQTVLVDAATSRNEKVELAFEGLKARYENLHGEKKAVEKTVNVVENVLNNVSRQNTILKNKLNLKGKIISNDNEAQSNSKTVKQIKNENVMAK